MNTLVLTDSDTVLVEVPISSTVSVETNDTILVEQATSTLIISSNTESVLINTPVSYLVTTGSQGPQGIAGESTTSITMVAGSSLSGSKVVCTDINGYLAYPTSISDTIIGISVNAAELGQAVEVKVSGLMTEPSWNWTLWEPIFLGSQGSLTQVPPTVGFSQIIAYPILPNRIFIDKQPPIILG